MRLIVITLPHFFDGEARAIQDLFAAGLHTLHLRKPGASVGEVEALLRQLPAHCRRHIVTHEHFGLADTYGLLGIHLNGRNPQPPAGYRGQVSCSCHTPEEAMERKKSCAYVFLSPIYDSISKAGYAAAFTRQTLEQARAAGIIDRQVIALGGIDESRLKEVETLGFGGAALLGDVWNHLGTDFIPHFKRLLQMATTPRPIVLSIAGSDPSGGAGIQADIKAISALGGYAASVVTALTVQNTLGVQAVYPVAAEVVSQQLEAVMDDLAVDAVKIGMVYDSASAEAIAHCLEKHRPRHVVYDPVIASTSGRALMDDSTLHTVRRRLFPLCTLLTPNLPEARLLTGIDTSTPAGMEQAARTLAEECHTAILVKGGHLAGDRMSDLLCTDGQLLTLTAPKVESRNLHGTGCTLSSAIATCLGRGMNLPDAVAEAKRYVTQAIREGSTLAIGHGNGPLWHFV